MLLRNNYFDIPNGFNWHRINLYPANFAQNPHRWHPGFIPALMLWAWAEVSILNGPGPVDPDYWTAHTGFASGAPLSTVGLSLALRVYPGAL